MYFYFKRFADFFAAAVLTVLLSPIMLVASVAVKAEDGGPILFKQVRPGKNCRLFTVYKFRTMSVKTQDSNGRELTDMERTTKVGGFLRKTSIDELPQLFNILKGDMSFIGPRPLLPEYLGLYSPEQNRRHEVLPGISGLAQVNGRNALTWDEKFTYDIRYVDNYNLKTDLYIFFKTIINVLKRDGINSDEAHTMEKFRGTEIKSEEVKN
ncbi:MAG: sugar transferase [Clostridia bacterium]|nr:sugar transferase [Clostridia bacterium]